MSAEFHLRLAGALQLALAAVHLWFPKYLNWKAELSRLSRLNHQIFLVHTVFICYVLAAMGLLSLFAAETLLQPALLSQLVLGGLAGFWGLRLSFQWFVYDRRLWRGNTQRTLIHVGMSLLWLYLAAVYAGPLLSGGP